MNKQIEELAEDIGYELGISYEEEKLPFSLHTRDYLAKVLIEKGYQKVDKDKQVVLSREEYNRLLACEHNLNVGRESYRRMEERAYKTIEELNQELAQERKETAEKIFNNLLKEFYKRKSCGNADVVVYEIAKQYGVDLGEEQ